VNGNPTFRSWTNTIAIYGSFETTNNTTYTWNGSVYTNVSTGSYVAYNGSGWNIITRGGTLQYAISGASPANGTWTANTGPLPAPTNSSFGYQADFRGAQITNIDSLAASGTFSGAFTGNAGGLTNVSAYRLTMEVNVLDFGANPAPADEISDSYNWLLHSNECGAQLQAAFDAAGLAFGTSNNVYLPPGIYMTTNTSLRVDPKVHVRGAGLLHVTTGTFTGSGTNGGYSLIWFRNTNATGLQWTNQNRGQVYASDFEVNGYSLNPLASAEKLAVAPSYQFANVGIQVYDYTNSGFCGGWYANQVAWSGFKIGCAIQSGQSTLTACSSVGCDISIANIGQAPPISNLGDYNMGWVNTYVTNYLSPHGIFGWVPADNLLMIQCNFGMRSNGVLDVLSGTRNVLEISPTHYSFKTWAILNSVKFGAESTYIEDGYQYFGNMFFVPSVAANSISLKDIFLSNNTSNGTNDYGESFTNQCWIYSPNGTVSADLTHCSGLFQVGPNGPVFLNDNASQKSFLTTHNSSGYREAYNQSPRYIVRVNDSTTFDSWVSQFYNYWGANPGWALATNFNNIPYGKVIMQLGNPDYLMFWGALASTYPDITSGVAPGLTDRSFSPYRLLQTDYYNPLTNGIPQQSGTSSRANSPPENYTVDQLTIRTNLILPNGIQVFTGSGSPEGAQSAKVGSLWLRTDSTGNSYTKTNGTGSTGWFDNLLRTHG
jgi:hypothetical protein